MKLSKLLCYTFLLITFFTFSECKKSKLNPNTDDGLPPATQTGANIFACKINGQNWISGTGSRLMAGHIFNDTISATGSTGGSNYFDRITPIIDGTGLLINSPFLIPANPHASILFSTNKSCEGLLGSAIINSYATQGKITITKIDTVNKIISGLFECKVPIPHCDSLKITNGRFDIRSF
jgi:hypothetical protein